MVNQNILYQRQHLRTTTTSPGFRRGGGGVERCGGLYGRPRSPCSVGEHPIFTRPQERATTKATLPIPTTLAPTGDDGFASEAGDHKGPMAAARSSVSRAKRPGHAWKGHPASERQRSRTLSGHG